MATLDLGGRVYPLQVTLARRNRCKDLTGVDVLDLANHSQTVGRLLADIPLAASVVFCFADVPQTPSEEEEFGGRWRGDAILEGVKSLFESLVDFCPSHQRAAIRVATAQQIAAAEQIAAKVADQIQASRLTEAAVETIERLAGEMESRAMAELSSLRATAAQG